MVPLTPERGGGQLAHAAYDFLGSEGVLTHRGPDPQEGWLWEAGAAEQPRLVRVPTLLLAAELSEQTPAVRAVWERVLHSASLRWQGLDARSWGGSRRTAAGLHGARCFAEVLDGLRRAEEGQAVAQKERELAEERASRDRRNFEALVRARLLRTAGGRGGAAEGAGGADGARKQGGEGESGEKRRFREVTRTTMRLEVVGGLHRPVPVETKHLEPVSESESAGSGGDSGDEDAAAAPEEKGGEMSARWIREVAAHDPRGCTAHARRRAAESDVRTCTSAVAQVRRHAAFVRDALSGPAADRRLSARRLVAEKLVPRRERAELAALADWPVYSADGLPVARRSPSGIDCALERAQHVPLRGGGKGSKIHGKMGIKVCWPWGTK